MPRQKTHMPHQRTFCDVTKWGRHHLHQNAKTSKRQNNDKERQTQTALLPQGIKPPLCPLRSGDWFHLSHSWVEVSQDDDIHVIEKVKGFILPQFYCMKTYHRHNRMQINIMPTTTDQQCRTESMLAHCLPKHLILSTGWLWASLCRG
jgi:hypothetical protein